MPWNYRQGAKRRYSALHFSPLFKESCRGTYCTLYNSSASDEISVLYSKSHAVEPDHSYKYLIIKVRLFTRLLSFIDSRFCLNVILQVRKESFGKETCSICENFISLKNSIISSILIFTLILLLIQNTHL